MHCFSINLFLRQALIENQSETGTSGFCSSKHLLKSKHLKSHWYLGLLNPTGHLEHNDTRQFVMCFTSYALVRKKSRAKSYTKITYLYEKIQHETLTLDWNKETVLNKFSVFNSFSISLSCSPVKNLKYACKCLPMDQQLLSFIKWWN